jgi:hypothetical protein
MGSARPLHPIYALGEVLQAEWMTNGWLSVYGRYTFIQYSVDGSPEQFSGNSTGFGLGFILPKVR